MKRIVRLTLVLLSFLTIFSGTVYTSNGYSEKIYLGGMPAGFSLFERGAYVVGVCDVITNDGLISPCKEAGVQAGDNIISIDNKDVFNAKDVENIVKDDLNKTLVVKRKQEILTINVKPVKDFNGNYKLGVFIRDNVKGIGTITYIKGDNFASLGHPVLNDNGDLLDIVGGELYNCIVTGVKKGERGTPGELHGMFLGKKPIGSIEKNLYTGVFGSLSNNEVSLKEIEIGEGAPGDASIFSTVNNDGIKEYKISIIKADFDGKNNKNFVIKVEDEDLIELTGGIVQGMSGSPIMQNGKLIGAITHVFINDPTRGFGISIQNMLNNK